jgi:hypothetical protein
MARGLEIDYETADRITIQTLKDHLKYMKEDLRQHLEEGKWLHQNDVYDYYVYIPKVEDVINYFSGNH